MRWLQVLVGVLAGGVLCLEAHDSNCCERRYKEHIVGQDLNGDLFSVDVGRCHNTCHRSNDGSATLFQQDKCSEERLCRPSSSRLRRVWSRHRVYEVPVVQSCQCEPRPATCTRLSHTLTVFPGTPFQTHIDIGACHGHCHQGGGCKPSRNRTVSVTGPNGASCHTVIEQCACAEDCHRVSQLETVYDYSHNASHPEILEVDIGRCEGGSCTGRSFSRCVKRSLSGECESSLYGSPARCSAADYNVHRFLDADGEQREIIAVLRCACG